MPIATEEEPEDTDEDAPCRVCLVCKLWGAIGLEALKQVRTSHRHLVSFLIPFSVYLL